MRNLIILLLFLTAAANVTAEKFEYGPLIPDFGKTAKIAQTHPVSSDEKFKVVFDLSEQGSDDKVNRKIDSLARFLNMHTRAGISAKNLKLALVVHGKAGFDLLNDKMYEEKFLDKNPNTKLLKALLKNNVQVILCGQSATYYNIDNKHLIKGVEMGLSAMTAHALLQKQGYTLNPF